MIKHPLQALWMHRQKENAKADFCTTELKNPALLNILQKLTTRQNVQK